MKSLITLLFALGTSLAALACAHAGTPDALDNVGFVLAGEPVNLNTASERELIELPGIGPTKAAAIVAYRQKHGAFARIDDLRKVKGFGRKTVAKLRPSLTVELPAPPAPPPPAAKEVAPLTKNP